MANILNDILADWSAGKISHLQALAALENHQFDLMRTRARILFAMKDQESRIPIPIPCDPGRSTRIVTIITTPTSPLSESDVANTNGFLR